MAETNPTGVLLNNSDNIVKRNEKGQLLPGVILNPAGKPKGARHFETLFREAVKRIAEGGTESEDVLIVKKVIERAKEGDLKATEIILDRTDGKVVTPIGNADGEPFILNLVRYEDNNNPPSIPTA